MLFFDNRWGVFGEIMRKRCTLYHWVSVQNFSEKKTVSFEKIEFLHQFLLCVDVSAQVMLDVLRKKNARHVLFNRNGTGNNRWNLKRRAQKLSQEQEWEGTSIYDTAKRGRRLGTGKSVHRRFWEEAAVTAI